MFKPERLLSLDWSASVLALPEGYCGARSGGLFGPDPAGSAETASNRWAGVIWHGGVPTKQQAAPEENVEVLAARGDLIAGMRQKFRGQYGAFAGTPSDGGLKIYDLHPSGFEDSAAVACDGVRLAGHGARDGLRRGLLWLSADAPPLELTDPSGEPARASGVSGDFAVGSAGWPGRALIWTWESTVGRALRAPELECTQALGIGDGQIVGLAAKTEAAWAAGYVTPILWPTADELPVRLLPEGCVAGQALDCRGGLQAGFVRQGEVKRGFEHAVLWCGSPFRYADLHTVLGDPWTDSLARSIHILGNRLIVLGEAWQMTPDRLGDASHQIVHWETTI